MRAPTFEQSRGKRLSKNKKIGLFAIGGLGGLAIIIWYRRHAASNANTAGTTTDTSGIDPNTGVPYADEYGGVGTTPGYLGSYDPSTGTYVSPGYGGPSGTVYSATNAMWAQSAEAYLVANGYDPATVAAALGLYLGGVPLTQNQYDIVQAALGFEGQPPNGAPPAQLISGGGGGQSGSGSGGGTGGKPPVTKPPVKVPGTVSVPNIVGQRRIA